MGQGVKRRRISSPEVPLGGMEKGWKTGREKERERERVRVRERERERERERGRSQSFNDYPLAHSI